MGLEQREHILGVGVDIIEVDRIARDLEKPFFASMFCSQEEIDLCDSLPNEQRIVRYAECFSVKEAVYKALDGKGHGLKHQEAVFRRDENEKPSVEVIGKARELADIFGITSFCLTFTEVKSVPIVICVAKG